MEKFIIGLFTEQLSTYIHGFKKEQVNASLLSGKGEISEIQVKVEPINEILANFIPFLKLASIYVSKLSFNAASIRNIRKAPIEISIDEVHIVIVERLKLPKYDDQTWLDTAKWYIEQAKKAGSYGLIERIRDNITLEINRIYVTFQPMGKFKTRKIGPWTPPAISVVLNNFRAATVDEFGEEGTPDDVWRHNSRQGRQEIRIRNKINNTKGKRILQPKTNMIFKKVTFDANIGIGKRSKGMSAKQSFLTSHLLFVNLPVQSHLAMHRQLRDNALLAVQADLSLTSLELVIESETLPLLVHALIGLQFCFIKDRSFVDPFRDGETDESLLLLNNSFPSYKIENSGSELKESEETKSEVDMNTDFDLESDDEEEENSITSSKNETLLSPSLEEENKNSLVDDDDWPAFVLPSGIVIFEKLCVSLSIHGFSIRAKYNSSVNGHLQFTMKGMVSEFIWPKPDNKRGGLVQLSLSHFNLHESYDRKIRTIINGGNHIEANIYGGNETTSDELFPLMETRDVRNDPFDLKTSFPLQAFGLKASIDLFEEEPLLTFKSRVSTLFEIGMKAIELTVYPEILERINEYFWSHAKNKFETRWFSGEWGDKLPSNDHIDIQQCIQPLPEAITKELELSSRYVNMTLRLSDLKLKVPAPVSIDLKRSSDILIVFAEIAVVISSSLPRLFLSEKIFEIDEVENFPIEESESNVRIQTTMNGFSIEVLPSPLYHGPREPQKVFYSKAITFLGSYDRLKTNDDCNSFLFLSILLHYVQLNVDFDVLAGATTTLLHYSTKYKSSNDELQPNQPKQPKAISIPSPPESLTLVLRFNLSKLDCRLWKQHIAVSETEMSVVPIIPILHFDAEMVELGVKINDMRLEKSLYTNTKKHEYIDIVAAKVGKLRLSTFKTEKTNVAANIKEEEFISLAAEEAEIICIEELESHENNKNAIKFCLLKNDGAELSYDAKIDLKTSTFRLGNELESAIFAVLQAIPNPESFYLLQPADVVDTTQSIDSRINTDDFMSGEDTSISFFNTALMDSVIIKIKIQDIFVAVPLHNADNQTIWIVCEKAQLCAGYLRHNLPKNIENTWLSTFRDSSNGFHLSISSQQRISFLNRDKMDKKAIIEAETLIKSFGFESYIHPLDVEVSFTQFNLSSRELVALNLMKDNLNEYHDRFMKLYTVVRTTLNNGNGKIIETESIHAPNGPLSIACKTSKISINSATVLLGDLNESLSSLKEKIALSFSSKNEELKDMRSKICMKEKDRFGVFALLTNDLSGYIRMGSASLSRQRIVSATNFWRYWVVLKKKNLIFFGSPSDAIPVDCFSLEGAQIVAMIGGGAKRRDLQKGFAIIGSNGEKRFFIAETYFQYEKWVAALSKVLSTQHHFNNMPEDNVEKGESISIQSESDHEQIDNTLRFDNNSIPETQSLMSDGSVSNDGINENFSNEGIHETISDDGTSETFESTKRLNFREKAKNRMTQIGTAVKKNVKVDKNAARQLNNDSLHSDNNSNPETRSEEIGLNDGNNEGSDATKRMNLREKAKNKMTQIGTAVKKNVKIDKNAIRQLNNGTFQNKSRKSITSNTNGLSHDAPLKVRGLKHGSEAPVIKEMIIHRDQKMCTVDGAWIAKVNSIEHNDKDNENSILNNTKVKIHIQCLEWKGDKIKKPSDIMITKDFSELMKFHAELSDALIIIRSDLSVAGLSLMNKETKDLLFAQVLHSGRLLRGLLLYHEKEGSTQLIDSICEVLEQLINAILSDPLPTFALQLSIRFLHMQDQMTVESRESNIDEVTSTSVSDDSSLQDYESDFSQIASLLQTCKVAISQASRQSVLASSLVSEAVGFPSKSETQEIKITPSPNKYSIALHNALMAVMVERDESQSQLMAERVFHTHELDQERRKIEMLEKKIEYLEKLLNGDSSSAAAFFLGQEVIPSKDSLNKIEETMVQNVDAELMELCRQLSSEISRRVSSELEVLRLKESRKIEREMESEERKFLDDQVNYYKQKMEKAQEERDVATQETAKWKEAFKKIVAIDPKPPQST